MLFAMFVVVNKASAHTELSWITHVTESNLE